MMSWCYFQVDAVLIAVGITAGVSLALTLFAFQTKWDFTACGGESCYPYQLLGGTFFKPNISRNSWIQTACDFNVEHLFCGND
jgi:hypothetical protein